MYGMGALSGGVHAGGQGGRSYGAEPFGHLESRGRDPIEIGAQTREGGVVDGYR